MITQERVDTIFVFIGIQRACAIHQGTTGFYETSGLLKDFLLYLQKRDDPFVCYGKPDVRFSKKKTQPAARHVREDEIIAFFGADDGYVRILAFETLL